MEESPPETCSEAQEHLQVCKRRYVMRPVQRSGLIVRHSSTGRWDRRSEWEAMFRELRKETNKIIVKPEQEDAVKS